MASTTSRRGIAALIAVFFVFSSVVGGAAHSATAAGDLWPDLPGVPHPNFPEYTVYYDENGGMWSERRDAVDSNNRIKMTAQGALKKAQAVPSSYWKRQVDAVKAGTSPFKSTAKVMEQGNLTKYSGTTVLVKEKKLPPTKAVDALTKVPKTSIPMTGTAKLLKAGAPMVGLSFGLAAGNLGARAFGFKDDMLCQETGWGIRAAGAMLNGVDCAAYDNTMTEAARNSKEATTFGQKTACDHGVCVTFAGKFATPQGTGNLAPCLRFSKLPVGDWKIRLYGTFSNTGYLNANLSSTAIEGAWDCGAGHYVGQNWTVGKSNPEQIGITGVHVEAINIKTNVTSKVSEKYQPGETQKANVVRSFECKVIAETGEGYYKASEPYREGDPSLAGVKCPDAPAGKIPHKVEIRQKTDGGSGEETIVYDQPIVPEYKELAKTYPECVDGSCLLDLRVDGASCFQGYTDCADWMKDPERDTRYSCKYGTHDMALAECYVYADLFKQDVAPGGAPWADPDTGATIPGGSMAAPSTDVLMDRQVQPADKPRNCFPTGWAAFNPVNWVMQPVQCALEWAFVPRAAVVETKTADVVKAWKETPPGAVLEVIAAWNVNFDVSGCDGFSAPFVYAKDGRSAQTAWGIPSACPGEPFAEFASWMRLIGGLVIVVSSALVIRKHAGASIGFNT